MYFCTAVAKTFVFHRFLRRRGLILGSIKAYIPVLLPTYIIDCPVQSNAEEGMTSLRPGLCSTVINGFTASLGAVFTRCETTGQFLIQVHTFFNTG